ncbi:MAG: co-chaperone GroES [Gemmatimonadetes bacterium]|nr:MAG: co-chaperone GroES [Gemmatimonadota bacterium]
MNFRPLYDNVLIKPIETEEKTTGGLFIPDSAKEKPQMGEVVAVGNGRRKNDIHIPVEVAVGQKVLYSKYGDTKITLDDVDYLVIRESNIFAILD